MSQANQNLDIFGVKIVEDVRDKTVRDILRIIYGKVKAPYLLDLNKRLVESGLNDKQLNIFKEILLYTVDASIDNFLWMVEQEDDLIISYQQTDLKETSDGLCGDYVGFVDKYSKFPPTDDLDPDKINL